MRIVAMADDERLSGVRIDQTLSDARAINPQIDCVQHDGDADRKLLRQIARWCERYTPLVSLSGGDSLFLDITGCTHLFGGELDMFEDFSVRLTAQGFGVKLALADTAGAAWALSHYGNQRIANPNAHQALLEVLPLGALRLSRNKVSELAQVGLKTIGCLIDFPRAPIAARFGEGVLKCLDQALGKADEILSPLQPVAELICEKRFPEPIVYEDDIKATIKLLSGKLENSLEKRGLGLRHARLQLFRADGEVTQLQVQTSNPLRNASKIAALFDERLAGLHEEWDAGFGFDIVQLCVLRGDILDAKQEDLVSQNQAHDTLAHLVDRLSTRLDAGRVQVYQIAETHIPERRFNLVPAIHHAPAKVPVPDARLATRPIVLFDRPEIAEVMAEVPEGPPIRFRWRKAHYEVSRSEGPERIACEWWKDGRGVHTRDYFRVETIEGYRLWLFRHGLYERETDNPKWYVHGMFA